MRFGVCVGKDRILTDRPAEADYFEIGATGLCALDEREFREFCASVTGEGIDVYSSNCLFPGGIRLTGDVDWDALRGYCDRTFYRLAAVGVKTVVFGSGQAKSVPDGFPREKAWDQLYRLGDLLAGFAEQYGQTVVVEPLSYREVNIINTLSEGAEYCRTVNRDNFRLLADFYHFDSNGEDWSELGAVKDLLYHTHISSAGKRSIPEDEREWEFIYRCLDGLRGIGYSGGVSFEGKPYDAERISGMISRMRQAV